VIVITIYGLAPYTLRVIVISLTKSQCGLLKAIF